jgi:hypothetical protein
LFSLHKILFANVLDEAACSRFATIFLPKETGRECRDCAGKLLVGLCPTLSLGVIPQKDCGVVADPLSDGMHRNTGIEEGG